MTEPQPSVALFAPDTRRPGTPTYERDTVHLGPFEVEPLELWVLLGCRATGSWRSAAEAKALAIEWLTGALTAAGVVLGPYDQAQARILFEDCDTPAMQAITGWLARARRDEDGPSHYRRQAGAGRLMDALERADIALGAYDRELPWLLVEDCGAAAARTLAGWIGRVGDATHEPKSAERLSSIALPSARAYRLN